MVKHAAVKMMEQFGLPVALVIIDTAGKAAGLSRLGEVNDDATAKIIIAALAQASTETGALFVGVMHFGKNIEIGTKGSTGFEDDADVVLALLGERGINGVVRNPVLCVPSKILFGLGRPRAQWCGSVRRETFEATDVFLMASDRSPARGVASAASNR
jgi:hypothetical protein